MNYSKAFTYLFEDRDWVSKILIAGLIGLIPVVGWIYLSGWMIEIIRRVRAGRSDILPRTHFSTFLSMGWKYFVISLVLMIPVFLIQAFTSAGGSFVENSETAATTIFAASVSCTSGLFGFFVSIFMCMMLFAATITFAETNEIRPSISYEMAFRTVKNNLKLFFLVYLFSAIAGLAGLVGIVFCIVGTIFTMPYAYAVTGHLIGQLSLEMNEIPTPIKNAAVAPKDDFVEGSAPAATTADEPLDLGEILDAAEADTEETVEDTVEEAVEEGFEVIEEVAEDTDEIVEGFVDEESSVEAPKETQNEDDLPPAE